MAIVIDLQKTYQSDELNETKANLLKAKKYFGKDDKKLRNSLLSATRQMFEFTEEDPESLDSLLKYLDTSVQIFETYKFAGLKPIKIKEVRKLYDAQKKQYDKFLKQQSKRGALQYPALFILQTEYLEAARTSLDNNSLVLADYYLELVKNLRSFGREE